MTEQQQPPEDDRRGSLRKTIYDLYQYVVGVAGEVSGKLSGEPGNMRKDCLMLRKELTSLILLTGHEKSMANVDADSLLKISRFLTFRVPTADENNGAKLRKYAKYLLKCVNWYATALIETGTLVVENE